MPKGGGASEEGLLADTGEALNPAVGHLVATLLISTTGNAAQASHVHSSWIVEVRPVCLRSENKDL